MDLHILGVGVAGGQRPLAPKNKQCRWHFHSFGEGWAGGWVGPGFTQPFKSLDAVGVRRQPHRSPKYQIIQCFSFWKTVVEIPARYGSARVFLFFWTPCPYHATFAAMYETW